MKITKVYNHIYDDRLQQVMEMKGFQVEFTINEEAMFIEVFKFNTIDGSTIWSHIHEVNGATSIFQYVSVMTSLWAIIHGATEDMMRMDGFRVLIDSAIRIKYTFLKRS